MDANGTRYHLLMGRDDWGACRLGGPDGTNGPTLSEVWAGEGTPDAGLAWDCERSELRLASRAFLFTQPGAGRPPRLADRRGAARDRHGTWYWIAPNGQEILVRSAGSNTVTHFWSATDVSLCMVSSVMGAFAPDTIAPPPAPLTLQGLAITVDNFLVVGTLKPGGLLLFDLFSGGPPAQLIWPVAWEPFDVSSRPGGGVWVLERRPGSGAGPAWIWEIDRQFRVVPPAGTAMPPVTPASGAFTPGSLGESVRDGDRVISRDDARPHQGSHPVAIEGLRDGTVLVVDSDPAVGFSRVWRYGQGEPTSIELVGTSDLERLVRPQDRATFALRAIDAAVVPAVVGESGQPGTDRLYVVSQSGNQAFAFDLTLESGRFTLRMREQYLPLRLFGGKGLVATDDVLPSYDLGDQWLPLVEQRRPLYAESAVLTTPMPADDEPAPTRPPLDGRVPDCTWHRLMLDACFPPDTGVLVESRAANDLETLRAASWQREPPPYLRRAGSEIPFQPTHTAPGDGTWELLFQRAKGRYLSLRLTVYGTGTSTPRIRAIRAWYPRFSYLEHYLPDVYRDCDSPAFFLDRYLANLEGIATGIEDRIAQVQMLFDVRSAPAETLQWLAGWYDLVLDPAWDERRRRLLIDHAMTFFQWRGTTHGLELALKLALDACVDERAFASPDMPPDPGHPRRPESFRIVESFLRRVGSRVLDVVDPEAEIAMAPAVMDPDLLDRWRAFLKRRYRQIGALNQAHRRFGTSAWMSFDTVKRIGAGDPGGAEPGDWRAFQDDVVTAGGLAHRFTVLLPGRDETPEQQQERAALVRRVVEVAKPAHTVFDVAFFWAAFRVGQARLGDDSIIDSSARAAFAMPPLMLSRGGLAQSYLASRNPVDACDGRQVIGQGNLGGETR